MVKDCLPNRTIQDEIKMHVKESASFLLPKYERVQAPKLMEPLLNYTNNDHKILWHSSLLTIHTIIIKRKIKELTFKNYSSKFGSCCNFLLF